MKPDIPIIGQREEARGGSVAAQWMIAEGMKIEVNARRVAAHWRVHELRQSCGIDDDIKRTVNVREPPRNRMDLK